MAKRLNGEGSLKERSDGRWEAKIQVGTKSDGKPAMKHFYAKTKREVKAKLDDYLALAKEGYAKKELLDLETYITNWLNNVKYIELKPRSFDSLEGTINNYIIPQIGYYGICDLTSDIIQKELINPTIRKNLSYSTVKKVYDALNACLKFATVNRVLSFNPMQSVTKPSKKHYKEKEIEVLVQDEIEALINVADRSGRYGYAIIFMLFTGVRAGEAVALRWSNINASQNLLTVNSSIVLAKNRDEDGGTKYKLIEQETTKTTKGIRKIYLGKTALSALEKLKNDKDFIICTKNGTPVSSRNLQRTFDAMLNKANLAHRGLHALRHSFASMLIRKGVDIKIVSELLGHKDVAFTYNQYVHIIDEQKNKAVNLLDDM